MAEMIGFRIERCAIKLSYSFSLSLLSDAVNRWIPLKVVSGVKFILYYMICM